MAKIPKQKRARRSKGPGRPVTTGTGKLVALRCREAFVKAVDAWRERQTGGSSTVAPLSRPAAIVRLAEIGLASEAVAKSNYR